MILEVMQQKFVADTKDNVARALRIGAGSADRPVIRELLEQNHVEAGEIAPAAEWMEAIGPHVMPGAHEDAVFLPGDRDASLMQSALQRYFFACDAVEQAQGAGAADIVNPISDVSLKGTAAQRRPAQLFGAMSESDIGWVSCLFAKAYRMIGRRRPFPDQPAQPKTVADNARVYLVGDWGSGVKRAKKVSDRIRTMMLAERTREQHVVHLGDVYYSGWPEEYEEHFLANWPVKPGEESQYGSWCLNANHDMFSGGHGFFDYLLRDARFAGQGGKSYFSLETSHWQLLGLDSAWTEGSLAGSQVEWVVSRRTQHSGKKIMLMTHHQPFSSFGESSYPDLEAILERVPVTAWYWGHEHRFALYRSRPTLKYPRLLGHSGVPVWRDAPWKFWTGKTPDEVSYVSKKSFRSGIESFLLFGFAVLDFEGDSISVRYIYENGDEEVPETLQ
jgi:hypothetical protein